MITDRIGLHEVLLQERGICLLTSWACTIGIYKIIQIVRALWLAIKPFYMSVCKHGFRSSFISWFPCSNDELDKTFDILKKFASRRDFLRLSRVLPNSRVFTSGYVNVETILHFFNEARSRNWIWLDKLTSYVIINNWFICQRAFIEIWSTQKFGEHERCLRVALGYASSNSSFLSALQTSQVLQVP